MDENQKKQFIALCCLIALVVGFGVYRAIGVRTSAAPALPGQKAAKATQANGGAAVNSQVIDAQVTATAADAPTLSKEVAGRDPFVPRIFEKPAAASSSPQPRIASGRQRRQDIPPLFPRMSLPPMKVQPIANDSARAFSDADLAGVKDLKLTGIVNGSMKLAIIRGSGNTRYIVREGQRIEGKYKVEQISSSRVWITFQDQKIVLRLGGNDSSEKRTRV